MTEEAASASAPAGAAAILIPTRNRSKILRLCLAALPQGVRGLDSPEVIVVDDCSTDDTAQVVEAFRQSTGWHVQCLRQEQPLGANAARNAALDAAHSEVVVFIDDDTLVTERWLPALLGGLSADTPVVTGPVRLNLEGPILGRHRAEVSSYLCEVLVAPKGESGETVPVACNMAAYRWVFEKSRFDASVRPPCEEGDWLRRAGVAAGFAPEALVVHYKTPEEAGLRRMLRLAWFRGSEGGWWVRERLKMPSRERRALALDSLGTAARAFGHALWQRCWGGVAVGLGALSRALALAGVINRASRVPQSWR